MYLKSNSLVTLITLNTFTTTIGFEADALMRILIKNHNLRQKLITINNSSPLKFLLRTDQIELSKPFN